MGIFSDFDDEDKRKSERYLVNTGFEFEIVGKNNEKHKGVTINLSSGGLLMDHGERFVDGGLLFESDINVNVGDKLIAYLDLPIPGLQGDFIVQGEVLRCDKEGDKYRIAVKFHRIVKHSFTKIKYDLLKEIMEID